MLVHADRSSECETFPKNLRMLRVQDTLIVSPSVGKSIHKYVLLSLELWRAEMGMYVVRSLCMYMTQCFTDVLR